MSDTTETTGNDMVTNYQQDNLFTGQPLDVYAWLEEPGNMGDTTMVLINMQTAAGTWGGTSPYATEYIENFNLIYPDLTIPGN